MFKYPALSWFQLHFPSYPCLTQQVLQSPGYKHRNCGINVQRGTVSLNAASYYRFVKKLAPSPGKKWKVLLCKKVPLLCRIKQTLLRAIRNINLSKDFLVAEPQVLKKYSEMLTTFYSACSTLHFIQYHQQINFIQVSVLVGHTKMFLIVSFVPLERINSTTLIFSFSIQCYSTSLGDFVNFCSASHYLY